MQAAVNIVPNCTGAAKAIGLVIPELNGKLIGSAQRVPAPTGSTTILTAVVKGKRDVTRKLSTQAMKAASRPSPYGYNEDEIVSCDIVRHIRYGSLFDATQTMVHADGRRTTRRFRLFPGMTTRTPTQARWFVQSNTSQSWHNFIDSIENHKDSRWVRSVGTGSHFSFKCKGDRIC